jgi:hypothetical protein
MRGPSGRPSRGDERIQMGPGVMPSHGMSGPMPMPMQALTPLSLVPVGALPPGRTCL